MTVRKRVFLGLVTFAVVTGGALAAALGALAHRGSWGETALVIGAWVGFAIAGATAAGVVAIALSVWRGERVHLMPVIRLMLEVMYPLTLRLGPLVGVPKERVQLSFVSVNNALADLGHGGILQPQDVLVLVPHCLQSTKCPHRITVEARNCRKCGDCQIGTVVDLAEKRGVHLAVATGGGMARKIIHDLRPKAVVAVACERDLTSGLLDAFPLPVIGLVNERPEGYCVNTRVNLERLELALDHFLGSAVDGQAAACGAGRKEGTAPLNI